VLAAVLAFRVTLQRDVGVDDDNAACHLANVLEDTEDGIAVQVVENAEQVHHVEGPVRGSRHSANVVLLEPKTGQARASRDANAIVHSLGAAVDGNNLCAAQRGFDPVDTFTTRQVEDAKLVEGFGDQVAGELDDPSDFHRICVALLPDLASPLRSFLREHPQGILVQHANDFTAHGDSTVWEWQPYQQPRWWHATDRLIGG
jgi:hypothetical protein